MAWRFFEEILPMAEEEEQFSPCRYIIEQGSQDEPTPLISLKVRARPEYKFQKIILKKL